MIVIIPLVIIICVVAWFLRPHGGITSLRNISTIITTVLSFLVGLIAVIFQLQHNAAGKTWVSDISNTIFIIGVILVGLYILMSIGFAIAHKPDIAKGIGFGACISIVLSIIEFGMLEWLGGV